MNKHIPRKRFGQHFLTDKALIEAIVDLIDPQPGETLVEIGPGLGAMTLPILARYRPLTVIELDRDLAARLRKRDDVEVIESDVLKVDFRALAVAKGAKLRVVGNLPYNISTPLMFHLISQMDVIRDMHFMLQKEMVDRLVASPGTSDWGRLSVMIQYHCDTDFLFTVPPEAFSPPPRVDSAIVRLTPHATLPHPARDYRFFAGLVNQVFTQRRKAIRNGLKSLMTMADIEAAGVDPGLRPDQLSLADFVSLANAAPPQEGSPSQETAS